MTPLKGPRVLFPKKINAETSTLKDNFDALNSALAGEEPGTAAYQTILDQLKTVAEMLKEQKKTSWTFQPSADVIVTSLVTIGLAVAVLKHEELKIITSKAWPLLPKLLK